MRGISKYLIVLALGLVTAPAGAAIWQWSKTASNNGSIDPTINWATGMAPSGIDPSGRAMMARFAEYRDDISGALVTGGISTAYTVTTNQSTGGNGICTGSAPADGTMIAITPNVTNGLTPTLTVDACSAAPIFSAPSTNVPVASMLSGTPYSLKYSASNTAWMLRDFYGNPFGVPSRWYLAVYGSDRPQQQFHPACRSVYLDHDLCGLLGVAGITSARCLWRWTIRRRRYARQGAGCDRQSEWLGRKQNDKCGYWLRRRFHQCRNCVRYRKPDVHAGAAANDYYRQWFSGDQHFRTSRP